MTVLVHINILTKDSLLLLMTSLFPESDMVIYHCHVEENLTYNLLFKSHLNALTVDFEEVKTAPTECKEKRFQMSHLPIFTIVKHLNVDDSS